MQRIAQYVGCLGMVAWLAMYSAQSAELVRLALYGFEGNASDSTGQQLPFELLWNAGISNGAVCRMAPQFKVTTVVLNSDGTDW